MPIKIKLSFCILLTCLCSIVNADVTASYINASGISEVLPVDTSHVPYFHNFDEWNVFTGAVVGDNGIGYLRIDTDPGQTELFSGQLVLGRYAGSEGTVTVTGDGARYYFPYHDSNSGRIYVGGEGSGILDINNGGIVSASLTRIAYAEGSQGSVIVDGLGSELTTRTDTYAADLSVGEGGNGTLMATNGAAINVGRNFYIGYNTTATGIATIDNSTLDIEYGSAIFVGKRGSGTLNIINGATVNCGSQFNISSTATAAIISSESTGYYVPGTTYKGKGKVLVSGTGSTWNINGHLSMAVHGQADMDITKGGKVIVRDYAYVGQTHRGDQGDLTGKATLTVTGAGSTLAIGRNLHIGYNFADGDLNIYDHALVSVAEHLYVYDDDTIDMATGGMLALFGNGVDASSSLDDFLDLITSVNVGGDGLASALIQYYDGSGWVNITAGQMGVDYTLEYMTTGDLSGYNVLTVQAVPEPATLCLLGIGALVMVRRNVRRLP